MARIDVPTLQCDRCKLTTQDQREMIKFKSVNWHSDIMGAQTFKKDLCSTCFENFQEFMKNKPVKGLVRLKQEMTF